MPGMRDRFAHFYTPDDAAVEVAMKTGLVAPDANVLLNLYRFQAAARDELFGAFETLGNRLWMPYQVGLEFQRNRLGVMKDQEGYFTKTREEVLTAVGGLHGKVRAFGNRLSLSEEQTKEIDDAISALNDRIGDLVLKAERQNEVRLNGHASDEILTRVDALFADDNSVGNPMESVDLEAARKEAERRIKENIPPGYKDKNKDDPSGDYIVWRQLMDEAKIRKLPVVFITDDSRSDDWYRREHGMTLGARRELREEMYREAGVSLLMMSTRTFLLHAETHLNAKVSKKTVDQAKDLAVRIDLDEARESVNRRRQALYQSEAALSELDDQINATNQRISALRTALELLSHEEQSEAGEHSADIGDAMRELSALEARREVLEADRPLAKERVSWQIRSIRMAEEKLKEQEWKASNEFPLMGNSVVLQRGDRVQHQKFGFGIVLDVRTTDGSLEYKIKFDDSSFGIKLLVANYTPMIKVTA